MPKLCECSPGCEIPWGQCHCGCGGLTPILQRSCAWRGEIKGQHARFMRGHRKRRTFCARGHNKDVLGRRKADGRCLECMRERRRFRMIYDTQYIQKVEASHQN